MNRKLQPGLRASRRTGGVVAVATFGILLAACGSSSSPSSSGATTATTATGATSPTGATTATTATAGTASSTLAANQCDGQACNVYGSVPWSAYKGTKVGLLNIAPIAGAYAWSYPLEACLKAHGASVQFIDINGNLADIPTTLQEFTSEGDKAVFDVGAPLAGQTSFLSQAKSKNMPVIGFDTGSAPGTVTQDTNDTADGSAAASYVIKELGSSKGTVLVLTYTVQPSTLARGQAAVAGLKTDTNLTVKTIDVPELSVQAGQEAVTAALQADPAIKAVIGDYSDYSVAAASAVATARSKAIVVGINGDPNELADIRQGGPLKATVSDNVAAIAQLSCQTGAVMLNGGLAKPGTNVEEGTTLITSANLPPAGKIDNSPTTFSAASS